MTVGLLFHVMISRIGCGYTGLDNYCDNYWAVCFSMCALYMCHILP